VARSPAELGGALDRARLLLEGAARLPSDDGIFLGEGPALGDLAFVFGGAAAPYAGMGQGLLLAFPELNDLLSAKIGAASLPLGAAEPDYARYLDQLLGASALMQAHALFTREVLGLHPAAATAQPGRVQCAPRAGSMERRARDARGGDPLAAVLPSLSGAL
jgi:hypothetical protein